MASNSDYKKGPGTVGEEASAIGQRVKGAVKTGAGKLTGNEQLEREGRIEKAAGNIRQSTNDVIDPARQDSFSSSSNYDSNFNASRSNYDSNFNSGSGTVGEEASAFGQRAKGAVKEGAGKLTGNERLEYEGRMENASGNLRQENNDVVGRDNLGSSSYGSSSSFGDRDNVSGANLAGSYPANQNVGNSTFDRTSASGAGTDYRQPGSTFDHTTGSSSDRITGASNLGVNSGATSNEYRTTNYSSTSSRELGSAGTSSFKQGRLVTGVFHDRHEAEKAWNHLRTQYGFSDNEISIVMSDTTRSKHFGNVKAGDEFKSGTKAAEGVGVGSALGGTLGAIVGAIAAIGTNLVIPGAGLVLAGPIAAAFAGAGAGGAAGGLIGGLVGAGIPEDRAREYDQQIRSGGIVLGVHARNEQQAIDIENYLRGHGAEATRR